MFCKQNEVLIKDKSNFHQLIINYFDNGSPKYNWMLQGHTVYRRPFKKVSDPLAMMLECIQVIKQLFSFYATIFKAGVCCVLHIMQFIFVSTSKHSG